MREANFTVYAAYYASDGFEWQQQVDVICAILPFKLLYQGDELNRIDVISDPPRVSCHAESTGEVSSPSHGSCISDLSQMMFECALYSGCVYEKPSAQFHQWTGAMSTLWPTVTCMSAAEDGEAYGLSFASKQEADALSTVIEAQKRIVDTIYTYMQPSRRVPLQSWMTWHKKRRTTYHQCKTKLRNL